jgi:hypothetical protein
MPKVTFSQSDVTLINFIDKSITSESPISMADNIPKVYSTDSVTVKMKFKGHIDHDVKAGIDLIFLIDQSGSEKRTDPDDWRLTSIRNMANRYRNQRDDIDFVSILTFSGDMENELINECVRSYLNRGRWSDVSSALEDIPDPEGLTPTQWGIERANNLLENSDRVYKIVILLSDGLPQPETERTPQLTMIMNDLSDDAIENRIIYSTVYVTLQELINSGVMQTEMGWMKYISEKTNYIYREDPDHFYIEVFDDMTGIEEAYDVLFEQLQNRRAPQEVTIYEKINEKLKVDLEKPVTFTPNHSHLVDYNELERAIDTFKETGTFSLNLKELSEVAELTFSVILDRSSLSDQELLPNYSGPYWTTFFDEEGHLIGRAKVDHESSYISYLKPAFDSNGDPTGATESVSIPCCGELIGIHQASIDYLLGFNITKSLNQSQNKVTLKIDNSTPETLKWYWIKEWPSQYFDVRQIVDNIGFNPFKMICDNLIKIDQFPEISIRNYGKPLTMQRKTFEQNFNNYLNTFTFHVGDVEGPIERWTPKRASGLFRMGQQLASMENKIIQFSIHPSSFLFDNNASTIQTGSMVDYMVKDRHASSFKSNNQELRYITQNPICNYFISAGNGPDLRISNCFSPDKISKFYESIRRPYQLIPIRRSAPWRNLDSKDINFLGIQNSFSRNYRSNMFVSVYNDGDIVAESSMMAMTFVLPVIEIDGKKHWSVPFFAEQRKSISIPPNSKKSIGFRYRKYKTVDPKLRRDIEIGRDQIRAIVDYIAINIVDIAKAENETYNDNNRAIEIINTMVTR